MALSNLHRVCHHGLYDHELYIDNRTIAGAVCDADNPREPHIGPEPEPDHCADTDSEPDRHALPGSRRWPSSQVQTMSIRIAAVALRDNAPMGPFESSGGVVHRITEEMAQQIADSIARAHDAFGVSVPLICAYCRSEGVWDPFALDPNLENAPGRIIVSGKVVKGGEWPTPEILAANSDYGLCQINGDARYMGTAGLGASLEMLCNKVSAAFNYFYPRRYPVEVALLAYNKGIHGAQTIYDGLLAAGRPLTEAIADNSMEYGRVVRERFENYLAENVI